MQKQIASLINELKSNKRLSSFDEASTKQAVVLRLLSFLGWDIFNVEEVYPNYTMNSSHVSFALRVKDENKIIIEVKKIDEKLDNHQKKFVNLASGEGVDLAVCVDDDDAFGRGFHHRAHLRLLSVQLARELAECLRNKPDLVRRLRFQSCKFGVQ